MQNLKQKVNSLKDDKNRNRGGEISLETANKIKQNLKHEKKKEVVDSKVAKTKPQVEPKIGEKLEAKKDEAKVDMKGKKDDIQPIKENTKQDEMKVDA